MGECLEEYARAVGSVSLSPPPADALCVPGVVGWEFFSRWGRFRGDLLPGYTCAMYREAEDGRPASVGDLELFLDAGIKPVVVELGRDSVVFVGERLRAEWWRKVPELPKGLYIDLVSGLAYKYVAGRLITCRHGLKPEPVLLSCMYQLQLARRGLELPQEVLLNQLLRHVPGGGSVLNS
ncbi:MAG: hypothetical protein ACPL3C_06545, partial [Pyrobaculum sp.]